MVLPCACRPEQGLTLIPALDSALWGLDVNGQRGLVGSEVLANVSLPSGQAGVVVGSSRVFNPFLQPRTLSGADAVRWDPAHLARLQMCLCAGLDL
jgi:hypothetical protein